MSRVIAPNLRAIHIIEILSRSEKPLTPTEINEELGLPKQSIHRLCQTLIDEGLLEKQGRKLWPRSRLLNMAAGLSRLGVNRAICHQILVDVARTSGETVNLVRPQSAGMTYIDRVETNWPFRVLLPVGTDVPFHCTASGKTYLANLPTAKRSAMVEQLTLSAHTGATITDKANLMKELHQVRRYGYALDREEFYEQMVAIAVPVFDARGKYFAALAIHGPKPRFNDDMAVQRFEMLQAASAELSKSLFS